MNALSIPGAAVWLGWLDTLLILSLQATLLAALVWVVIKLLGRWIPPSWRALLWFVVIARVLIPVAPPSAFSLQNVFVKPVVAKPVAPAPARIEFPDDPRDLSLRTTRGLINSTVFLAPEAVLPKPAHREINPAKALGIIWAVGAVSFLALLIARSLIIRSRLVRHGRAPDARVLEAIEECRAQLGLRIPIRVTVSDRIAAPALTGLIPARLILPSSFNAVGFADGQFEEAREDARPPSLTTRQVISLGEFTSAQVRQILLHELAHIKQGHLFLHWIALIARAVHWFNPAIHFAAAGLRQECELAADAAALKNSNSQERAAYGETILQVLSHTTAPPTLLAMGLADRARHLEQRLRALNRPNRRGYHVAGIAVVIAAALTGLSGADLKQQEPEKKSEEPKTETPRIQFGTIRLDLPPSSVARFFVVLSNKAPNLQTEAILRPKIFPLSMNEMLAAFSPMGTVGVQPPSQVKVGDAFEFALGEEPAFDTNTPVAMEFPERISVRPVSITNQVVTLEARFIRTTFLGYNTNELRSLPRFRVNEIKTNFTLNLPIGGTNVAFYIPARTPNRVTTDTASAGRYRVHHPASMSTNACLVIITPTFANNDISIPHGVGLVNTIPNVVGETTNRVPVLGDIPILGRLFQSERETNDTRIPVPPGHLDVLRDERVQNSPAIKDARMLIEVGRIQEAETLLKRSLEEDPGNRSAQYYLDLIQGRSQRGFRTYSNPIPGSERFKTDLKDSFVANDGSVPVAEKNSRSDETASSAARQTLIRKLETIRLDAFPVPSDTDLSEVLKEIGSEIRKRDQNGHGVNLIISLGAYSLSRAVPPADVEKFKIKFDPPLRDVSVRQLFDAIVHVAKPPDASPTARLRYSVEDYAVIFSEDTEEPNQKPKPVKNADASGATDANRGVSISEVPVAAGWRDKLLNRLDTIRIDNFPLATPVDLIEVVKELTFETRKRDPEHQGVNFVLDKAKNRALNLNVDLDRFKIKIDPPVRDVTLRQLCEVIVRVATPPPDSPESATLEYAVADYGIVFSARPRESAQMVSRSFRVDPNTFMQGLQGVLFSANSQNGAGANANGGGTQAETIPASLPLQERLRALMRVAGVDFPTNNVVAGGAVPSSFGGPPTPNRQPAIFFNDRVGVLFVRATREDLDRIESAIHAVNAQAKPNKE